MMKISTSLSNLHNSLFGHHNGNGQCDTTDGPTLMSSESINLLTPSGLMQRCDLRLTHEILSYRRLDVNSESNNKQIRNKLRSLLTADIIGCSIEQVPDSPSPKGAFLNVIAYPIKNQRRRHKLITFIINDHETFEENHDDALKWKNTILALNICDYDSGRKYLFIVNPVSGQNRAMKIFNQKVKPILAQSEVNYELFITQYANHAMDMLQNVDISQYYGIVVVSGDGLLYEVINGIMKRDDAQRSGHIPVSLGIIPGGSGNGLAKAINYSYLNGAKSCDLLFDSVLNVIQGHPMAMDLVRVTTMNDTIYSFLALGWGLISDIDIESERLRIIGEPRFTVWAVMRAFALRRYHAQLSYLPADSSSSTSSLTIPPLNSPLPSNWVKVEGEFVSIYCAYQTHVSTSVVFAPDAKFDDGIIWLTYIYGNVTRKQAMQFLLALEKGKHIKLPYVNVIPVRALRIEPKNNVGKLTVDGELIECGPVQAQVIPRMGNILTRQC